MCVPQGQYGRLAHSTSVDESAMTAISVLPVTLLVDRLRCEECGGGSSAASGYGYLFEDPPKEA